MQISRYSLKHCTIVWFVLMLSLVGGVWSFVKMGKKEDSTFVLKSAVVTCNYPGATPLEVEQLISEPISRELQSMRKVKKITSESYYGRARIVVELESGTRAKEIPQLWDELRRKVSNISSRMPVGAEQIVVNDDFSDVYGLYYALVAEDGFGWSEMREWAQRIKREVVTLDGVQKVALFGEQTPVINIYITKSTLANFALTPEMILSTIAAQNNMVESGDILAGEVQLRILETGVYKSIEDISSQLLFAPNGRQYRLGDIARIEMGYVDPPRVLMQVDGKRAIGVGVSTDGEADVVEIGRKVNTKLTAISNQMPLGMEIETLYPEDEIARQANLSFMLNLLVSVLIVIVVIVLAMGFRAGTLIGMSLIFTIGLTMLCMYGLGEGINRTSLAGFIIAMGMLVDNAIVVVDNALNAMRRGVDPTKAFVDGAEIPKWGLLGATLIAIFSFLPLYLAPSSVAEIVKPLFVVIALSLMLSWLLALTQVPMFGVRMLRQERGAGRVWRMGWFSRMLEWCLGHRVSFSVVVVAVFAGSVVVMSRRPQNFFPQLDKPYFRADVILPEGYDLMATQQNLDTITQWLREQEEVVKVSTTAGATPLRYYLASGSWADTPNYGNLLVQVSDKRYTKEVKQRLDRFVRENCPDVWLRSSLFKLSPVADAAIEIGFMGSDIDTLLHLTTQAEKIMWQMEGAENVRNSWGNRIPTWLPVYSQTKGQRVGVGRSGMVQWMTLATSGYKMGEFRRGDEFIPILLKDADIEDYDLSNLESMPVFSQSGRVYSMEQVSSRFDFDYRADVVKQYNRQRVMKAQCDPKDGVNTLQLLGRILKRVKSEVQIPEGYEMKIFGEQESQVESNEALRRNMPLALVLIFVVLLLLFDNLRDPIVVLLMTPLIFVGVVLGLIVTANTFDFFSLLGLLGLIGMNVKNGVILISSIRRLRAEGMDDFEAVVMAAEGRLLPVSLASLTTILALVPLLFDSLFASMAATIMGGLLVATMLTMLVLPVAYSMVYGINKK